MSDAYRTTIAVSHEAPPTPLADRGTTGRAWGYAGALLGGLVSIGANTAHSYVPPAGVGATWRPPLGAVIGAVFWPIALFVAIEILARTSWPDGARWVFVRFLGLVPVAVVAAIVSYNHLSGLLGHYGEDRLTTVIGPLAVDGLMVMSSAAVMATTPQRGEPASPLVSAPVTGPPMAAAPDTIMDSAAATDPGTWAPRLPLTSTRRRRGAASRTVRTARTRQTPRTTPEQPGQAPGTGQAPDTNPPGSTAAAEARRRLDTRPVVAAMRLAYPDMTPDKIADKLGVTERTVRRHLTATEATA